MDNFGHLLKKLRTQTGLTQKEFADKLNVTPAAVSKWETDRTHPDIGQLKKIANILSISCDDLLHPTETLEKLKELENLPQKQLVTKTPLSHSAVTSPKKIWKLIALVNIPMLLIICVTFYLYTLQDFNYIEARTNVDTPYGPAYELIFISRARFSEGVFLKHAQDLNNQWENGELKESAENVLIVSYYLSVDDISEWDEHNTYFQFVYLKEPLSQHLYQEGN